MTPKSIAPHVHQLPLGFVNAYAIETPEGDWVLVDTGLKNNLAAMLELETHFGKRPIAILLTHGHMDHVGCASELAEQWGVKVYAHRMERPYLIGKSIYPPKDPTVGGPLAQLFRAMPMTMPNLTSGLELLPDDGILEFLPGWRVIETPGAFPWPRFVLARERPHPHRGRRAVHRQYGYGHWPHHQKARTGASRFAHYL